MPIIKVDLSKMRKSLVGVAATSGDMDRLLQGVGAAARARWVMYAQQTLHSTARDYIGGIQDLEVRGKVARIVLVGAMPNLVEQGMSSFDMRTTLLGQGSKAKTAKDGSRYNTIPFGHGTPGSSGRNVGRPMPTSIHAIARTLAPSLSRPEGGTQWGGRLGLNRRMSSAARAILTTKEKPWHWGSTFMGMVKQQKGYVGATQNKYTTFRTISTNVSRGKEHWLHPGIAARRLSERVQRDMPALVQSLFGSTMRSRR